MRYFILGIFITSFLAAFEARAQDCTNPDSDIGVLRYNADYGVFQGCTPKGWIGLNPITCPDGYACSLPTGCSNIGDACSDGSIYAGDSPDGNVPMYTTPADAPGTYTWNDGSTNWVDTGLDNCSSSEVTCRTGDANTAFLAGLSGSGTPAPYSAAEYCDGLSSQSHNDWYLPSIDELTVLFQNMNLGNLAGTLSGSYWSSSEASLSKGGAAFAKSRSVSTIFDSSQDSSRNVRCVRKQDCETGPIGTRCSSDGAIYAGEVGGNRIYAAACDVGMTWNSSTSSCDNTRTRLRWKTTNTTTAGTGSLTDGEANTDAMATAGIGLHPAAEACRNIGSEWYLPAINELAVLGNNSLAVGGFNTTSPDEYWSSSEEDYDQGYTIQFDDVRESFDDKINNMNIRCIRK